MRNRKPSNDNSKFNPMDGQTYKLWQTCLCGCGEVVRNRFAPGHDMRVQPHHAAPKAARK